MITLNPNAITNKTAADVHIVLFKLL